MSKTLYGSEKPLLDAHLTGFNGGVVMVAPANTKTKFFHEFTGPVLLNGIDFFAHAASEGDNITLWTEYYAPPLEQWKRYKKFGKCWGVIQKIKERIVLFPTKPTTGVRMVIEYDNTSQTEEARFITNLFQFANLEQVDTSSAAEGVDW